MPRSNRSSTTQAGDGAASGVARTEVRLVSRRPIVYGAISAVWLVSANLIGRVIESSINWWITWVVLQGICVGVVVALLMRAEARRSLVEREERRKAEDALRVSARRYRDLVQLSPDALIVNRANRIESSNPAALELFGCSSADQLSGKSPFELFHPAYHSIMSQRIQLLLEGQPVPLIEEKIIRLDGVVRNVEVAATPFDDDRGRAIQVVLRDVTERKQAEERLAGEKERLSVTLRSIGDGVIATDVEGRITILNAVAESLTGWKAEEAAGHFLREVFVILDEETRRPVQSSAERVLGGDGSEGAIRHTILVSRDGAERPISDRAAPIRGVLGELSGTVLVFRDQSEERRAEAAVIRSQRELLELVEKLPIGVFVSLDGRIIYANPTLAEYLNCSHPSDLIGEEPEDILGPTGPTPETEGEGRHARPSLLPGREWRVVRRDGRTINLESAPTREIEFDGRPAVLWVLRDITDLKAMQAQLMQSDRLASVGMLAAGVAHEINNPLAYLIAALDFIEDQFKETAPKLPSEILGEVSEALAEAREGAERVKHVVRDLRTFSRVHEDRLSKTELVPVIESSINMAANEIKYRAHLVRDYGVAPKVLANEARLGQVFLNLLINAAQAIQEGHVDENQIRVSTRTDEAGRAVVEVSDSGSGISPELMERIFDPFFTTKPLGIGTGLGLSICRNIVSALGGEVSVTSNQQDRGAIFRVVLPPAPSVVESEEGEEPPHAKPGRRGRILVVDDEPAIGVAIRRALSSEHDVTVLTSAHEARDRIAQGERYDVVFCDLMMPKMTGMDLHAEVARMAPDQAQRMVLLTGGTFTVNADEFLKRVPNSRIEKPFDPSHLKDLVRSLVI